MIVLGLDPSFRHFGVCVAEWAGADWHILSLNTIHTEGEAKKRGVRVASDDVRCIRELMAGLLFECGHWSPDVICAELPSGAQSGKAHHALGIAKALVASLSVFTGLPIAECSPADVKKAVTRTKSASKDDIIATLKARYPDAPWAKTKKDSEHAADALGAILACEDSDVIRMAKKLSA